METWFAALDVTEYYLPFDDLSELFGNKKRAALEIGVGEGDFLIEMSKRKENWNFIGIEIRGKRFRKAVMRSEKDNLRNLKFLLIDAKIAIEDVFSSNTFDLVYINFPDPWPKERHRKHRLINAKFLDRISNIMKPLAALEIASDHEDYLSHILKVFQNTEGFKNESSAPGYVNNLPDRPMTKYETEFRNEGRNIYYLRFINLKEQNP